MYIGKASSLEPAVDLRSYERIVVAFSGGKDSLACLLHLLEQGATPKQIELHHHDVDGGGRTFMDWPITPAYCRAVAAHFALPLYFSAKEGGFEREMLKSDAQTAPIWWERPDGTTRTVQCDRSEFSTRRVFPQTSANLSVRWCSSYLKIDVMTRMVNNEPRFLEGKTLIVTGERGQESKNREQYAVFEPDKKTDNRASPDPAVRRRQRVIRHVDHWRPVKNWSEAEVWAIIKRHGIVPHPAYQLGWGRLSCRQCIFGSANQWATIQALYPAAFDLVADYEDEFGLTIKRGMSVRKQAERGTAYPAALAQPELAAFADQTEWRGPIATNDWQMPAGAFGESAGPS
jgi:3'-phosphoadenosine 5'-phosphosulfate sulfotransferase (PAPS reductase)/FAD synthetase